VYKFVNNDPLPVIKGKHFKHFLLSSKVAGEAQFVYIFRIEVLLETITFARALSFEVLIVPDSCLKSDTYIETMF